MKRTIDPYRNKNRWDYRRLKKRTLAYVKRMEKHMNKSLYKHYVFANAEVDAKDTNNVSWTCSTLPTVAQVKKWKKRRRPA